MYDEQIQQTREGWWVLKEDTHLSRWVEQAQRLDHDQPVLKNLLPYIKPGSLVYDLGAAIGDHTIFYLNAVGPEGKVLAFEPHPVQFECLQRNCPKALCLPYALGETEGQVMLFHEPAVVAGSRLIDPALQWPGSVVRQISLDKNCLIDGQISLMKIDIEGSETAALRGGRQTICRHKPTIWMEINPTALERQGSSSAELHEVLDSLGYRVAEFYPDGADWNGYEDGQCDALCLPVTS
jgi:FkbM family methyltransferase